MLVHRPLVISALMLSILFARSRAVTVVDVFPASHSLTASRTTQITITFDVPMDSSTIHSSNVSVFGRWSGVAQGVFILEDNTTRIRFTPSRPFSAGEWVTVSVSKNVRSQSGENLSRGYEWNFWIGTGSGTLSLTEIQRIAVRRAGEGHIQTYGAHGGDLDNDGYSDFFVPNEISNDCRVFLNDRTGRYSSFTVHPIPDGSRPSTNESADFNHDGNLDIAVGNSTSDSVTVFLGNGAGGFMSTRNFLAAGGVRGLAVCDLEGDGDADIVTANRSASNVALLVNSGSGTFPTRTIIDANANGETACMTADANNDGILDLFVGSYVSGEISVLLGNGAGGFTFSSKRSAGGNGPWMIAVGDVNNDGKVDVVSANSGGSSCSVLLGDGQGGLSTATSYPTGAFPIAIDLGDVDGDGDLDMITSNYSSANWTLYENNGAGVFSNPRIFASSRAGSCITFHDRDNDGDLDMTGIDETDDLIFLFRNGPATVVATEERPAEFELSQNYPNPFNPTTTINYQLPTINHVTLKVFNVLGREVATLVDGVKDAGQHEATFDAANLSSGVYLYRITTLRTSITKKMMLLE